MSAAGATLWLTASCLLLVSFAAAAAAGALAGSSGGYRIWYRNGSECVFADLSGASFSLPYPCHGGGGGQCRAEVALPPANCSRIDGRCGNLTAQLEVAWSEGRIRLELVFMQRTFQTNWAQVKVKNVTYSYVSGIRLLVDLRDPIFVNATIKKGESPVLEFWRPEKERAPLLFAAPASSAFVCRSPEEARLPLLRSGQSGNEKMPEAVATFPAVRVAVSLGGGEGEAAHDGDFLCEPDSQRHRTGIAALVIAGVIGVCMLIIVVGYLVTRLNKNSHYSNME